MARFIQYFQGHEFRRGGRGSPLTGLGLSFRVALLTRDVLPLSPPLTGWAIRSSALLLA